MKSFLEFVQIYDVGRYVCDVVSDGVCWVC